MLSTQEDIAARRIRVTLVASRRRATAAIVVPPARGGGPAYRGNGEVDYVCGCCSTLLCSGVHLGMFASLAFACACGAVNTMP